MDARRIMIALAVTLVLLGGATYFWRTWPRRSQGRSQGTKIVAAAHAVPAGTTLTVDDIKLVDWPLNSPPEGSFSKVDDVVGRVPVYPLGEKEPVLRRYLADPSSGIGIGPVTPPSGMRAIAIRSDGIAGVTAILFPGSHVDAIHTYTPRGSSSPVTETVLRNVEVISPASRIQRNAQGKAETVNVVVLLVPSNDAEKLLRASSQGQIQFVLRNGVDTEQPRTPPVSLEDLTGAVPPPVATRTTRTRESKAVPKVQPVGSKP